VSQLSSIGGDFELALVRLIDERVARHLDCVEPTASSSSPWMTVAEAAAYLRTSPGAVYKRIKRGQLQVARPEGSPILIHRDVLSGAGPRNDTVLY
jgi:excisionase family DNA binding protein